MIRFVLGSFGSGKSTFIISHLLDDLKRGGSALLIVPEQQAVSTERLISDMAQGSSIPTVNLEVLNFRRLCNRVFRRFGGLSYNNIKKGAHALVMWQALFDVAPILIEYTDVVADCSKMIPLMLDTVKEFKVYNILPEALTQASLDMKNENRHLSGKLHDLGLIYSAYEHMLHRSYDDPSDELTRLSALLKKENFFGGFNVYIDSFSGFTPQEFEVLRHIFSQADNVTLSLCLPSGGRQMAFDNILNTERQLERLIPQRLKGSFEKTILETHPRYRNGELKFLEENLWKLDIEKPYGKIPEHIRVFESNDIYTEAEIAAKDIMKRIRSGCRYRDIAVIMRNVSSYTGIIDAVFDKYELPYHISRRVELKEKPLFKLILSALSIHANGWRADDIIAYLKTGLTGISPDDCDLIEEYTYKWNICGKRWYDGNDWYMNPDGYRDKLSDEGALILTRVNEIRAMITDPLQKLFEAFDGSCTIKESSAALYDYLCELNIPDMLASSGEEEQVQLWNALCDALDQLVTVLHDFKADAQQYSQLLSFVIRETDIGTLPAAVDEIEIGSANLLRAGNIKHCYLIGVNDGIFPAEAGESGVFSDSDKIALESYGIALSPRTDSMTTDELFWFYRAATCPSESLTVIYSVSDLNGKIMKPSIACGRIFKLFPKLVPVSYSDIPVTDKIEGKDASFEYTAMLVDTACGEALRNIYSRDSKYYALLRALDMPISERKITLSKETVSEVFGGDIALTQSRLDNFVLCAFGYHCNYTLRLSEHKRAEFKGADTGTFVHHVLEKFMSAIQTEAGIKTDMTDRETEALVDDIIGSYLDVIFGKESVENRTNRMLQLILRLRRIVLLLIKNLIEEFSQSDFVPAFFEMNISDSEDSDSVQPLEIPLPDGNTAYVYGVIDRVDTYKQGNDVYVRVVDYKTGAKDFSLTDLYYGLNLQMLLYLFTLWTDKSGRFRKSIGCTGEIKPAGVLYYSARVPEVPVKFDTPEEAVLRTVSSKLKRSGLLINDADILRAMEKKLEGRYIPVKLSKDGKFKTSMQLDSIEDFGKLMREITEKVSGIAEEIKNGRADAIPLKTKKHDGCKYCSFKAVCRHLDSRGKEEPVL